MRGLDAEGLDEVAKDMEEDAEREEGEADVDVDVELLLLLDAFDAE